MNQEGILSQETKNRIHGNNEYIGEEIKDWKSKVKNTLKGAECFIDNTVIDIETHKDTLKEISDILLKVNKIFVDKRLYGEIKDLYIFNDSEIVQNMTIFYLLYTIMLDKEKIDGYNEKRIFIVNFIRRVLDEYFINLD